MATQLFKGKHSQFFQAHRVKGAIESGWTTQPTEPDSVKKTKEPDPYVEELDELEDKVEELDEEIDDLQDELKHLRQKAKEKGIKGWHVAGVEKLKEKLNEA